VRTTNAHHVRGSCRAALATLASLAVLAACGTDSSDSPDAVDDVQGDAGTTDTTGPPPTECAAGQALCACGAGDACEGDLACEAGICRPAGAAVLAVSDPAVRACDVLLTLPDATEASAVFEAGSMGVHVQRGPHVAVSFGRRTNSPFGAGAVAIHGGGVPAIATAECFDRLGAPVSGAEVELR
jgi:hypothetical protein